MPKPLSQFPHSNLRLPDPLHVNAQLEGFFRLHRRIQECEIITIAHQCSCDMAQNIMIVVFLLLLGTHCDRRSSSRTNKEIFRGSRVRLDRQGNSLWEIPPIERVIYGQAPRCKQEVISLCNDSWNMQWRNIRDEQEKCYFEKKKA